MRRGTRRRADGKHIHKRTEKVNQMVQMAIVRLSDLKAEGRWDVGFHIALSEMRDSMSILRERYDDGQATALVDALPLADKASIEVLRTGPRRRAMTTIEAQEVARRYPHLSLAMVARDAEASVRRINDEIERNQDALKRLIELSDARTTARQT